MYIIIVILLIFTGILYRYKTDITIAIYYLVYTQVSKYVGEETRGKAKILTVFNGYNTYDIPLPFVRTMKPCMIRLIEEGVPREIRYPKGCPFFCTARQLGVDAIEVERNGIVTKYTGDEEVRL